MNYNDSNRTTVDEKETGNHDKSDTTTANKIVCTTDFDRAYHVEQDDETEEDV